VIGIPAFPASKAITPLQLCKEFMAFIITGEKLPEPALIQFSFKDYPHRFFLQR
jgi:hypothetical protein